MSHKRGGGTALGLGGMHLSAWLARQACCAKLCCSCGLVQSTAGSVDVSNPQGCGEMPMSSVLYDKSVCFLVRRYNAKRRNWRRTKLGL